MAVPKDVLTKAADNAVEALADGSDAVLDWWEIPWVQALMFVAGALLLAFVLNFVIKRYVMKVARATKTSLDDDIIEALRKPLFITVGLVGCYWALARLGPSDTVLFIAAGVFKTVAILLWSMGLSRIVHRILGWFGDEQGRFRLIQPRTIPIFEIVLKIVIAGGAAYAVMLSWDIDVTGWLASAGVVGIAVGFAAKDTLANLFSGVFIIADSPYKLGDFIILGSGERGVVTDIGIRSTRLLTRDDIEIIVPNAVIANSKIVNESGGPHEKERVRCTVSVAYGSDVQQVSELLLEATQSMEYALPEPEPRVRFREFGESGLVFQAMCWVEEPALRGRALHTLNSAVYNTLNEAGIEIPYPKRDVYLKGTAGLEPVQPHDDEGSPKATAA